MFKELQAFAAQTPLSLQTITSRAQMMLSFGIDQKKIIPFMKALSDVSAGNAQTFNSLSLAFSQMSATGKLMGQDLLNLRRAV